MRSLLLVVLLAALALGALALPAGAHARVIAVADQNPAMFSDPAWQQLGVRHARVAVPWNLAAGAVDQRTAATLDAAHTAGVNVLVAWTPSGGRLPSRREFATAFAAFRERWPHVREFSTWNEPNLRGQPTARRPELLAGYWTSMRRACRRCTILAPELVDFPSAPSWARRFERAVGARGLAWGLHNYQDVNRFRPRRRSVTAGMLRAVSGPIWLTETGGLVRFARNGLAYDERRARRATRHLFALAALDRARITRIYVYHWQAPAAGRGAWDSGLLSAQGRPRPAFWTFTRAIANERRARRRACRKRAAAVAGARARRQAARRCAKR